MPGAQTSQHHAAIKSAGPPVENELWDRKKARSGRIKEISFDFKLSRLAGGRQPAAISAHNGTRLVGARPGTYLVNTAARAESGERGGSPLQCVGAIDRCRLRRCHRTYNDGASCSRRKVRSNRPCQKPKTPKSA